MIIGSYQNVMFPHPIGFEGDINKTFCKGINALVLLVLVLVVVVLLVLVLVLVLLVV